MAKMSRQRHDQLQQSWFCRYTGRNGPHCYSPHRYGPHRFGSPDHPAPLSGTFLTGVIHVQALSKLYGELAAVRELSFSVAPGEVLGLVGPNGAGKTTTLRCLAGIINPTAGTVSIAGISLGADPVAAKRQLAFIPDEPHLFEYLSVEEHLRFTARLYGVPDAAARSTRLLEELELTPKRDALPGELSRGMRQKLAIACGLLHEPAVVILDEPLTGLDPAGIRRMKATIRARAAAGSAAILSSHLLHLVEEVCDRVLVLRAGELVALGTIEEIVAERPKLQGRSLEEVFLALTGEPEAGEEAGDSAGEPGLQVEDETIRPVVR